MVGEVGGDGGAKEGRRELDICVGRVGSGRRVHEREEDWEVDDGVE